MRPTFIIVILGIALMVFVQKTISWVYYKRVKAITTNLEMYQLPLDSITTPAADTKYYRGILRVDTISAGKFPFLKIASSYTKSSIFSGSASKDDDSFEKDMKEAYGIKN